MDIVLLATEKTIFFCDNLQEGYNELFYTINVTTYDNPDAFINTCRETFYNEMGILRSDIINIGFFGSICANIVSIQLMATY
jgi:hypothetical protein